MKKLVALIIALVILLSFAMAEETTVGSVVFTEIMSEEDLAQGVYDKITDDFPAKIWVPNDTFIVADLSEIPEEYSTGLEIGMFKFAADENLKVIFSEIPNDTDTFDDLIKTLKEDKDEVGNLYFSDVEEAVVNGVRAVSYKSNIDDDEIVYATYEVSDVMWLNIMAMDSTNEDYAQAVNLICRSVAAAE